jgi:hypothetical protein
MRPFDQIREDVYNLLNQTVGTDKFWALQHIKDSINDAYIYIADETMCFRLDFIIEVVTGIRTYKLPSNYVHGSLNRVEFDSERIYEITSAELDAYSPSWRTEDGDPKFYLPPGDIGATDELVVYPKPDTDGAVYNIASTSEDYGVVTTIGDTTYEEFNSEEGVITSLDGEEAHFDEMMGAGPVMDIKDPTDNLRIFGAKYPVRLYNDKDVPIHPLSENPKRILTIGALSFLFAKEGQGKDIAKASYYNKRFQETIKQVLGKAKLKRTHRMRSVTEGSIGYPAGRGQINLGNNYPSYFMR